MFVSFFIYKSSPHADFFQTNKEMFFFVKKEQKPIFAIDIITDFNLFFLNSNKKNVSKVMKILQEKKNTFISIKRN